MSSIYEGLGRSITEALSCGVPVVCTAVEGVPEIIKDDITGILVPPKDSNKLADGIIRSLKDMESAKIKAEEGRRFVQDNFDVNKMVEDIDALYHSFIKFNPTVYFSSVYFFSKGLTFWVTENVDLTSKRSEIM